MITEMNGKKVNCKLVRRKNGETSDNRNLRVCELMDNCESCAWNADFAKKADYQVRKLTRKEANRLKEKYGIEADGLKCLERV